MCTENLKTVTLAILEVVFWLGVVNANLGEEEVVRVTAGTI